MFRPTTVVVVVVSGVFMGALVRGPLWPDRRDFCNYFFDYF